MFELMQNLDYAISNESLEFSRNQPEISWVISKLAHANDAKGLISAILFWILWFYPFKESALARAKLTALLFVTLVAITLGRALANFLPFRARPRANPDIFGDNVSTNPFFSEWSSMPSDHAIMFFSLSAGFFLISRKIGILSFIHSALVVCLPRIIVNLHYFSDIVVGALIGIALSLVLIPVTARFIIKNSHRVTVPDYVFYPFLFFITYSYASMFNALRDFGGIFITAITKLS